MSVTPVEVEEGNSSTQGLNIVIQLSVSMIPIGRDIVYTVELQDGTATGEYNTMFAHLYCTTLVVSLFSFHSVLYINLLNRWI